MRSSFPSCACAGVRKITAFAPGAFIEDSTRFAHPKKPVNYVGLNPAFDESGKSKWSRGIGVFRSEAQEPHPVRNGVTVIGAQLLESVASRGRVGTRRLKDLRPMSCGKVADG